MESTSTISLAATPTVILTAPPVATTNVTATTPLKLTPDLRKVRDSLAPETLMYYNCITSNEDKVNYLKAMRIQIKKEHEKGILRFLKFFS
ncbi:hypothetical protein RCL_jg22558.t1 [Rhizophagus clarus]|uniref:Uncharacterized protein n=1 Tax=Rhizophagus clarus TaxID=94130 RepID=A0A8H3MFW3_9GLOM|nr:hypothetical protein RCL_jg22558.t1 [Rhizophagus clarus]